MKLNLKRAASLHLLAAAILAASILASCDDDDFSHPREVIITNENGKVITGDTIPVKNGSTNRIYIKLWYNSWQEDTVMYEDEFYFWRQYDNNEPEDLSFIQVLDTTTNTYIYMCHQDVEPGGDGRAGFKDGAGAGWCEYNIRTAFSKKFVHVGSLVKIWACVGEHAKGEVYYKVVE